MGRFVKSRRWVWWRRAELGMRLALLLALLMALALGGCMWQWRRALAANKPMWLGVEWVLLWAEALAFVMLMALLAAVASVVLKKGLVTVPLPDSAERG